VSHIAAALAKSKGKAVNAPKDTELVPAAPAPIDYVPPPATGPIEPPRRSRGLIAGAALAVMLLGAAAYLFWPTGKPVEPQPAAPAPRVATAEAVPVEAPRPEISQVAGAPAPAEATSPTRPATPEVDMTVVFETVRAFSISAVKEGTDGRAMIDGKLRHVGDEVAPGIWLHGIDEGRVLFRDEAGQTYPRRF